MSRVESSLALGVVLDRSSETVLQFPLSIERCPPPLYAVAAAGAAAAHACGPAFTPAAHISLHTRSHSSTEAWKTLNERLLRQAWAEQAAVAARAARLPWTPAVPR